jgi:hypothetical protein
MVYALVLLQVLLLSSAPSVKYGNISRVALWPKTGRKHQLRRHLSLIGHPIIGETFVAVSATDKCVIMTLHASCRWLCYTSVLHVWVWCITRRCLRALGLSSPAQTGDAKYELPGGPRLAGQSVTLQYCTFAMCAAHFVYDENTTLPATDHLALACTCKCATFGKCNQVMPSTNGPVQAQAS